MNPPSRTVLIVDDEAGLRLMIRAVLEDAGWTVLEADHGTAALDVLGREKLDAALIDMRMPGMDGKELLKRIKARKPNLPVIMLTAFGSVGSAVEAMKIGAFDYLTKPADNEELKAVLDKAHAFGRLVEENESLKQRIARVKGPELIGVSEAMRQVRELIDQAGPTEASILIQGESGTGKELVAEGLHRASARKSGPLVKVNCAALPADLLESELFGYAKGAFTGAVKDKPGRFQLADGGTLLLDEIGEMPLMLQAKLLRALQEKSFEPLGSVAPVTTDARILASTNKDLRAEVDAGRFREDLYFRFSVLEITIAPLRDRPDDIPPLTAHLLKRLGKKNSKEIRAVSQEFMDALARYSWPGNVRELENVLERAIILSRSDTLEHDLLPPQILDSEAPACPPSPGAAQSDGAFPPPQAPSANQDAEPAPSLELAEKQAIVQALEQHGGHREQTADALGISRRTLQYKLKKYGLTRR